MWKDYLQRYLNSEIPVKVYFRHNENIEGNVLHLDDEFCILMNEKGDEEMFRLGAVDRIKPLNARALGNQKIATSHSFAKSPFELKLVTPPTRGTPTTPKTENQTVESALSVKEPRPSVVAPLPPHPKNSQFSMSNREIDKNYSEEHNQQEISKPDNFFADDHIKKKWVAEFREKFGWVNAELDPKIQNLKLEPLPCLDVLPDLETIPQAQKGPIHKSFETLLMRHQNLLTKSWDTIPLILPGLEKGYLQASTRYPKIWAFLFNLGCLYLKTWNGVIIDKGVLEKIEARFPPHQNKGLTIKKVGNLKGQSFFDKKAFLEQAKSASLTESLLEELAEILGLNYREKAASCFKIASSLVENPKIYLNLAVASPPVLQLKYLGHLFLTWPQENLVDPWHLFLGQCAHFGAGGLLVEVLNARRHSAHGQEAASEMAWYLGKTHNWELGARLLAQQGETPFWDLVTQSLKNARKYQTQSETMEHEERKRTKREKAKREEVRRETINQILVEVEQHAERENGHSVSKKLDELLDFDYSRNQLDELYHEKFIRRLQKKVRKHPSFQVGEIKFFKNEYGFIEGTNGKDYFFHLEDVLDKGMALDLWYYEPDGRPRIGVMFKGKRQIKEDRSTSFRAYSLLPCKKNLIISQKGTSKAKKSAVVQPSTKTQNNLAKRIMVYQAKKQPHLIWPLVEDELKQDITSDERRHILVHANMAAHKFRETERIIQYLQKLIPLSTGSARFHHQKQLCRAYLRQGHPKQGEHVLAEIKKEGFDTDGELLQLEREISQGGVTPHSDWWWDIPMREFQISPFLATDLSQEYSKVEPDFVEISPPQTIERRASSLFNKAMHVGVRRKHSKDPAVMLLNVAMIVRDLHKIYPDFVFSLKTSDGAFRESYESTMNKILGHYSAHMAYYHQIHRRFDVARAYYLEHFRLVHSLSETAINSAVRFLQTYYPVKDNLKYQADDFLKQSSGYDRVKNNASRITIMFAKTLELANEDKALNDLFEGLFSLARVNPQIRKGLINFGGDPSHPWNRALKRLNEAGKLSPSADKSIGDWLKAQIVSKEKRFQSLENDFEVVDNLLRQRRYQEMETLLRQMINQGHSFNSTDVSYINQWKDVVRDVISFGKTQLFTEKDYLWQRLRGNAERLRSRITEQPTYLGRIYVLNLQRTILSDTEKQFTELIEQSRPQLSFTVAKTIVDKRSQLLILHINIRNVGLATAEDVVLTVKPSGDAFFKEQSLDSGAVRPDPHSLTEALSLSLIGETEVPQTTDILVSATYYDRKRTPLESFERLRITTVTKGSFRRINNPFITGNIVEDENMFKGRDKIITELIQSVCDRQRARSELIFGQKRAGKSSILYHLANRAPSWSCPVYYSLHEIVTGKGENYQEAFLSGVADAIQNEVKERRSIDLPSIHQRSLWSHFNIQTPASPTSEFRKYIENINKQLGPGRRLLLLLDEFTDLIEKISLGQVEPEIMRYLKSLGEKNLFSLVVSGMDTMPEALKRYANDLAIANPRRVSYLDRESAFALIDEPLKVDGHSRFPEQRVLEDIYRLTAGSPYYLQLFCHRLVEYMNKQQEPVPTITGADVDKVIRKIISGDEALSPWQCFDNLCRYKEWEGDKYDAILEGIILFTIADQTKRNTFATLDNILELTSRLNIGEEQYERIINDLEEREVLDKGPGENVRHYRIRVDLFKRWIVANRPLDKNLLKSFKNRLGRLNP